MIVLITSLDPSRTTRQISNHLRVINHNNYGSNLEISDQVARVATTAGVPTKVKAKAVKDNHKGSAKAKASDEATADILSRIKLVEAVRKAVAVVADMTGSKDREVAVVNPRQLNNLSIPEGGGCSDLYILLSFPIIFR